jgi:hypothetical protein
VRANLRPNAQGIILLEDFPVAQYATLHLVATNLQATVQRFEPLGQFSEGKQNPVVRDLRLLSNLKRPRKYCETRRSKALIRGGDKTVLKADSESVIIDNVAQLFEIQRELIVT